MSEPAADPRPGFGHTLPPEPIETLDLPVARTHRKLVMRFIELELGCGRVPDPIETEEDAAAAAEFIAQCEGQIKIAELTYKKETNFFLKNGRVVDGCFERFRQKLTRALKPVGPSLKIYHERLAEDERTRLAGLRRGYEAEQAEGENARFRDAAAQPVRWVVRHTPVVVGRTVCCSRMQPPELLPRDRRHSPNRNLSAPPNGCPATGVGRWAHPDEWCRPLDRSPCYRAQIDAKPAMVDRLWLERALRPISGGEYRLRIRTLRHWARRHPVWPKARPRQCSDFARLPPLF